MQKAVLFLIFLLLTGFVTNGFTEEITVETVNGLPGQIITLDVVIDNPAAVSAAVFTVSYDEKLSLTGVASSFFDTFSNQWAGLVSPPNPLPPTSVTVDSEVYDQPLLANTIVGAADQKTLIAAVRVSPGAVEHLLFTLEFSVDITAADGSYPVSISHTTINNPSAGHDGTEYLPILIHSKTDESNLALAYESLPVSLINGLINVNTSEQADNDGDLIPDWWENYYFLGNITLLTTRGDYDDDGYSDYQEYLNRTDPTVKNSAGGPGYKPPGTGSLPAIFLLLLQNE